jgi:hypothetical protein
MGKYRATMNLGGHRRGEVLEYDESDPVLVRRVAAGWLTRVDAPVGTRPVVEAEKPAPKKRPARKRAAAEPESGPEVEGEPLEPEVEAEIPVVEVEESSVQTSWYISPTQTEG